MRNFTIVYKKLKFQLLTVLASFTIGAPAQNFLEVPVKLEIEKGDLSEVVVKVKKDGKDAFTQSGASKMRFKLDFNKKYTLIFTKPGYITKTIEINTMAPEDRITKGFEPYKIGVQLFLQNSDNTVIYKQPVAQIRFDNNIDDFNFVTDYSKSILAAVTRDNTPDDPPAQNPVAAHAPAPAPVTAPAEAPRPVVAPAAEAPKPAVAQKPAEAPRPVVTPAVEAPKPAVAQKPAEAPTPVVTPAAEAPKPAVAQKPAEAPTPVVTPAAEAPKPAVARKPAEAPTPVVTPAAEAPKPAVAQKPAEAPRPVVTPAAEAPKPAVAQKPAEAPMPAEVPAPVPAAPVVASTMVQPTPAPAVAPQPVSPTVEVKKAPVSAVGQTAIQPMEPVKAPDKATAHVEPSTENTRQEATTPVQDKKQVARLEMPRQQVQRVAEQKALAGPQVRKERPQVSENFRSTAPATLYQPVTTSFYKEDDKVVREDIVDGKRIITKVKVTKNGITTEYTRVNYTWGGTFYFRNNTQSISPNLFAYWTGVGY